MSSFCSLEAADDGFFVLKMSSSDGHQYLAADAIADLVDTLRRVREDESVKGLVTTSETGSFCDGIDYEGGGGSQQSAAVAEVVRLLLELPVPTVAAVRGNATSLGVALALAHDHCVVWDHAELSLPEARLGRPLPGYVAALLRDKLSYARLRKLLMLGSRPCAGRDLHGSPWFSARGGSDDRQLVLEEAVDLLYDVVVGEGTDYAKARQTMWPDTCAAVGIVPSQRPRPSPQQLAAAISASSAKTEKDLPGSGSSPSEVHKSHRPNERIDKKTSTSNILEHIILDGSAEPTNIPFSLLQEITKDFSDERKIGSGGFAVVYKGVLRNGSVAVKRLLNSQTVKEDLFYGEANFLMNVKHPNIVRFLGFCANTENQAFKLEEQGAYAKYIYAEVRERLFCFEYISKGSLDNHLTDELRGLEWHKRYQLIRGICEGLQYLHKEKRILHMDLKPANILLDDHMVPKITDFGISRHLDGVSQAITKERLMSLGYCAPEYLHYGEMSFKSDIYGLGVIIKELVTGRKEDPNIKDVLRRWRYRWNKSATYPPTGHQQVARCIELAVRCTAEDSKTRPYIWDIVSVLNGMECTDESISIGQINPYPWELLSFDPLELHFPFELTRKIPYTLHLTNDRDDHIAFKICTMNAHYEYQIEPSKGVVPLRSGLGVTITPLQVRHKLPQGMMRTDKLKVWMVVVEDSLIVEEITPEMFHGQTDKAVDEVDLTVVFET